MNLLDLLWAWLTGKRDDWQAPRPGTEYRVVMDAAAKGYKGDPMAYYSGPLHDRTLLYNSDGSPYTLYDEYGVDLNTEDK